MVFSISIFYSKVSSLKVFPQHPPTLIISNLKKSGSRNGIITPCSCFVITYGVFLFYLLMLFA